MAKDIHGLAVADGLKAAEDMGALFSRLGTGQNPSGAVLVAYRNARRGLRTALKERNPRLAAREVMSGLRVSVYSAVSGLLHEAAAGGYESAGRQLAIYGVSGESRPLGVDIQQRTTAAAGAVQAALDAQAATLDAMILGYATESMILGDEQRAGVLRPADVIAAGAYWLASLWWDGFDVALAGRTGKTAGGEWKKQAVAALDNRTTDCCLRVHGQIKPFDEDFHLTGTPRFADDLPGPPFHWYCRTAIVLYQDVFDMGLTDKMVSSANTVLAERKDGIWNDRHPADAFV